MKLSSKSIIQFYSWSKNNKQNLWFTQNLEIKYSQSNLPVCNQNILLNYQYKLTTILYNINLGYIHLMLQAANNFNNIPSHPNIMMPSVLGAIHPNNTGNINGKIISRSPNAIQLQDQRSLSPNKLNATKKPMMNNQNQNYPGTLNNFLGRNRGSPSPTPKSPTNVMPNLANNFNSNFINHNLKKQPLLNSKGFGRRASDTAVPFPSNMNQVDKTKYCMNHATKTAEFVTEIQAEQYGYCQKCAINLASKGFTVVRKNENNNNKQIQNDRVHEQISKPKPFHNPQFVGVLGYNQVEKFVGNIDSIYTEYIEQTQKYQKIQQHYQNQMTLTSQFYQSLLQTVEQMKEDHLADLQSQAKKHHQLALIKQDSLKSDLEELEAIRYDIIQSLEIILSGFQTEVIQETFGVYKQKIYALKDKIQEQNKDFSKEIIDQKQQDLKGRLKKIQQYLLEVWNDKKTNEQIPSKNNQFKPQFVNRQPQINKIPMANNAKNESKQRKITAYRKLFDDDNDFGIQSNKNYQVGYNTPNQTQPKRNVHAEELIGQTSPQFKNI